MLNPQYSHFDPDDAEKLSDARYKWGPSEVVEEVEELARRGFKSRMRFYHNIDIVGTPQYNRHAELLAELEKMIKDRLLNRELIAFGREKDPFAGYRHIPPENWWDANIDFDENILAFEAQPESKISNIIVFKPAEKTDNQEPVKSKRIVDGALEKAYIDYVQELVALNQRSSRKETHKEMQKRCGKGATFDRLKPLREKHYPSEWLGSGNYKKV